MEQCNGRREEEGCWLLLASASDAYQCGFYWVFIEKLWAVFIFFTLISFVTQSGR
jgi:hypothetical protein